MAGAKVLRCKACWHGDCADCTQWTDKDSLCRHRCDVQPRQMALPWVTAGMGQGSAGTGVRADPAHPEE